MMNVPETARVAIVGGGPVGLYLALVLAHLRVSARVFERHPESQATSRSIGVHPPSIELLAEIGLADRFLASGVSVRCAEVHGDRGSLGRLSFQNCRPPHRYVLTIPQNATENILRAALEERAPGALEAREVLGVEKRIHASVALRLAAPQAVESRTEERRAYAVVVGCDGKNSVVRRSLGIPFAGGAYAGEYAMADFPDATRLGRAAAIYLGRAGLLESFPLPGGMRRWVARCVDGEAPTIDALVAHVRQRAALALDGSLATHVSSFRAERRQAARFARGRVALAGDAAQIVSPIGGQGMNLGWLGARSLAQTIATNLHVSYALERALARDGAIRQRVSTAAARRAELNMWLGRPQLNPWMRDSLVSCLLGTPASSILARVFTMRGLALGW